MKQNLEDIPDMESALPGIPDRSRVVFKTIAFIVEIAMVAGLLAWWLSSDSAQKSHNLWVLFLYSFPSEFIIATVPHEPVLIYFAKFHAPVIIALVAISGTVLTEALNYNAFKFIADLKLLRKMLANRAVGKTVALFNKHPFAALWIAGFTPIPFYPFRFLVVIAHYPLVKYLTAVILSRTPRFFLLALLGRALNLSDLSMVLFTVILIACINVPFLIRTLKNKWKKRRSGADDAQAES
jgi:membrane protein YqaA with SNARE-associated domain